jgi:ankyrin repeat protein
LGNLKMVKCLAVELGADVNQIDIDGCTPLYLAAYLGKLGVIRCLVNECGADVIKANNEGCSPLLIAANEGKVDVVRLLVEELGADVNQAGEVGGTPLYVAAQNGRLDIVRCLVDEHGADVNQAAHDGSTPLMIAADMMQHKVVRYLFKHGADPQATLKGNKRMATDLSRTQGAPAEQTAYLEARTHCANPDCSGAGLKKCAKCLEVFFCSKECQVAAWPAHKADCKRRVEAKASKKT